MIGTLPEPEILSLDSWQALARKHRTRVLPWVNAFRERREQRKKHPVHDFLFEYYQCKRRLLADWHPRPGNVLQGKEAVGFLSDARYSKSDHGIFLDLRKIKDQERSRARWIGSLIEAALTRRSQFQCFGLHEWAMVYRSDCIRHTDTPLRLSKNEIETTLENHTICCTHYDAFRFFSKAARPLNTIQPREEDRSHNEQFGCVHFNMDLFKWCYKLYPWISSELTADCFLLAAEARELDMRASPYDLREYGYTPIPIETTEGRRIYQAEQQSISAKGRKLARQLLEWCQYLDMRSSALISAG